MSCACNQQGKSAEAAVVRIRTVSFGDVAQAAQLSAASLSAASAGAQKAAAAGAGASALGAAANASGPFVHQVHVTDGGDVLTSTAFADGNAGDVVLRGTIGPIPYEIHVRIELQGDVVVVTLTVRRPFEIGPVVLRFRLGGIVRGKQGDIAGASSVSADPDTPAATGPGGGAMAMGLSWWCVLRCGGVSILAILIRCLPALAGGPAAYIACVTSQAGAGAAGIAACIASKCV